MRQMTEYLVSQIQRHLHADQQKQVIRVDGFDDLNLYRLLCERMESCCLYRISQK